MGELDEDGNLEIASCKLEMDQPQSFVEEIDFAEIRLLEVVGKGSFGVVRKGQWENQDVAVKMIETESEKKAFIVEVRQLSRVSHPNIVKLYGACTKSQVCLIMEYAEGGSLYNVLHGDPQPEYTASHAVNWALQCAKGVAYLHGMKPKPLIHRDLKPPNLLLIAGGTILKICDFGTACDARTHMTNNKGSAAWMAPEVFEGPKYSEKCDVFSWGIILWEVITRRKPFDEIGGPAFRIMWAVHSGQRPPLIQGCPTPFEELMNLCWEKDPTLRPSMDEVVEIMSFHFQFFEGYDEPIQYPALSPSSYDTSSSIWDTEPPQVTFATNYSPSNFESNTTIESVLNFKPVVEQTSAPASLASSLDNLENIAINSKKVEKYSGDSSQLPSGNFHDSSNKRLSVDLSDLQMNKQEEKPNKPPFGHQRTRSYGSSFIPDNVATNASSKVNNINVPSLLTTKAASSQALYTDKPAEREPQKPNVPEQMISGNMSEAVENAFRLLDPQYQPITPCHRSLESMKVIEEHKKMAHEYLLVQTELALLIQRKKELGKQLEEVEQMDKLDQQDNRKIIDEFVELQSERVSLLKLHESLKQQLAISRSQQHKKSQRGKGKNSKFWRSRHEVV